ncbi:hypothetical protein P7K49_026452 [Saguinus oedipus]|uniref:Zinc finger protein ZFAT n=1 Tax=Saguinus oedipus TaxID=9490 RepID=A0ABQ9UDB2_SAGOE|nr:hypothetical protein P7K49_026452 [Saguinus oedipus]
MRPSKSVGPSPERAESEDAGSRRPPNANCRPGKEPDMLRVGTHGGCPSRLAVPTPPGSHCSPICLDPIPILPWDLNTCTGLPCRSPLLHSTIIHCALCLAPETQLPQRTVVTEEEPSSNHTVMIQETLQQASVELAEQHHLVVSSDDVEGIETVTVYTQGGEASEFIVYVQEAMRPGEEQAVEQPAQEL